MLKPAVEDIISKEQSRYSLVIAVAKQARKIANDYAEREEILIEKPVKLAVQEFADGLCSIQESSDTGDLF